MSESKVSVDTEARRQVEVVGCTSGRKFLVRALSGWDEAQADEAIIDEKGDMHPMKMPLARVCACIASIDGAAPPPLRTYIDLQRFGSLISGAEKTQIEQEYAKHFGFDPNKANDKTKLKNG